MSKVRIGKGCVGILAALRIPGQSYNWARNGVMDVPVLFGHSASMTMIWLCFVVILMNCNSCTVHSAHCVLCMNVVLLRAFKVAVSTVLNIAVCFSGILQNATLIA